jgi:CRISPR system Cascade subunit CasA
MSQFNLIDEPWIPIRYLDGTRVELGLRDTLLRAQEIEAIEDPSPLVVAALHRFLLAVLYRALMGPTDIDQARQLFHEGFSAGRVNDYLTSWRDRFWLFDEKYPFFQIPSFEPKIWRAWTALAAEHNADNARVLFDHVDVERPGNIPPASCARWILAAQTFSVSCGKSELAHTGTAPSATAALIIPLGVTLSDTLLFCLVPQQRDISGEDRPVWERDPETVAGLRMSPERMATGLADRYTWRTRSVRLLPEENGTVIRIAFASGVGFDDEEAKDPMLAYRIDEKRGILPIMLRERGLWRDFDSLLPDGKDTGLSPKVIDQALRLVRRLPDRFPRSVLVVGQRNDKAKIEFWRMERFALPRALVGEQTIRSSIRQMLDEAENAQKSLWSSSSAFARNLLSRGNRMPDTKDARGFVEQMPIHAWYWSALESRFHEVLREYTLDRDPDEIRCQWLKTVREILQKAWSMHQASVISGDAWAIRALVRAEGPVLRKLGELTREIAKYENKEVVCKS